MGITSFISKQINTTQHNKTAKKTQTKNRTKISQKQKIEGKNEREISYMKRLYFK